jgi:hypothetical protein
LTFHVPSGGSRKSLIEGVNLKRQGVKAGILDIFMLVRKKDYSGLIMEIKRDRKCKVSVEQQKMLGLFKEQGFYTGVCYGFDDLLKTTDMYLALPDIH